MRVVLLVLIALAVAAPVAAQTALSPIEGAYEEVYVIAGRALDANGNPTPQALLVIELEQEGVRAAPLRAAANCKGDFITAFSPFRHVDPNGKARITLVAPPGGTNVTTTVPLDPFYRRSDATLQLGEAWPYDCSREADVWDVSASVSVRLLNRTDPYERDGEAFHARPYTGFVRLRYETPAGNVVCPPHPQSGNPNECEIFSVDARGDLRYTFTLDAPFSAGGRVDVILQDNTTLDVPIDPATRLGVKYFEITGRGPAAELYETPLAPFVPLAAVGLAALAARSLFPRRQR